MSETSTSTPALEPAAEPHVHRWRVTFFEASHSMLIGYRCSCGEERFERPEPQEKEAR